MKKLMLFGVMAVTLAGAAVAPTAPTLAQTGGTCQPGSPAETLEAFNQDFGNFVAQYPQKSSWGMRDTYQYAYFIGVRGLEILMRHQACMSPGDFAANYQQLVAARDQGRNGCQQVDSGGGCTPTYPTGY